MKDNEKEKGPLTVLVIEDHPDQRDLWAIGLSLPPMELKHSRN
jgi:hypothetical protein